MGRSREGRDTERIDSGGRREGKVREGERKNRSGEEKLRKRHKGRNEQEWYCIL